MSLLRNISIQGFRAVTEQIEIPVARHLTLIYAENSQGKTSVAESLEFLFTGATTRHLLIAPDKREFRRCLRNVYRPDIDPVVSLTYEDTTEVRRSAQGDYEGTHESPTSRLEMKGPAAADFRRVDPTTDDIPPYFCELKVQGPVLLQHNLRSLVYSKPTERWVFLSQFLGIEPSDEIVVALDTTLQEYQELSDLTAEIQEFRERLVQCNVLPDIEAARKVTDEKGVLNAILSATQESRNLTGLIERRAPSDLESLRSALEHFLTLHRQATKPSESCFRLEDLDIGEAATLFNELRSATSNHRLKEAALKAAEKVIDEVSDQLVGLFKAAAAFPEIGEYHDGRKVDCPLCETKEALDAGRIELINEVATKSSALSELKSAEESLARTKQSAYENLRSHLTRSLPTMIRVSKLSPISGRVDISRYRTAWRAVLSPISKFLIHVRRCMDSDPETLVTRCFADSFSTYAGVTPEAYQSRQEQLRDVLASIEQAFEEALLANPDVTRANELLAVARQPQAAIACARAFVKHEETRHQLEEALEDMKRLRQALRRHKLGLISDEVKRWYETLRPQDPVEFHSLEPSGEVGSTAYIKFLFGKYPDGQPILMDAISVLSDSQLNALGLAIFAAKNCVNGLLVLDDPIVSLDIEHSRNFRLRYVKALLEAGNQVIILTHDSHLNDRLPLTYKTKYDVFTHSLKLPKCPSRGLRISEGMDSVETKLRLAERALQNPGEESAGDTAATHIRRAQEGLLRLLAESLLGIAYEEFGSMKQDQRRDVKNRIRAQLRSRFGSGTVDDWNMVFSESSDILHEDRSRTVSPEEVRPILEAAKRLSHLRYEEDAPQSDNPSSP